MDQIGLDSPGPAEAPCEGGERLHRLFPGVTQQPTGPTGPWSGVFHLGELVTHDRSAPPFYQPVPEERDANRAGRPPQGECRR